MSFLAGLRQRNQGGQRGLQLCYLISASSAAQGLHLAFSLREEADRRQNTVGKTYRLQREHLVRPPAFITVADSNVLQDIVELNPGWVDDNDSDLPISLSWDLLERIVSTRRALFIKNTAQLHTLKTSERRTITPSWCIGPSGDQALRWQVAGFKASPQLFSVGDDIAYMVANGSEANIGVCERSLENSQAPLQTSVSANKVDVFLSHQKNQWQSWGMPLPRPLLVRDIESKVKPLIYCTSKWGNKRESKRENKRNKNQTRDEIHLKFSLCSDSYCSLPSSELREVRYWNGSELCKLNEDPAQGATRDCLNDILSVFEKATEKINVWRPDTKTEWQRLFVEFRKPLMDLGADFIVDSSFSHHYILVNHWQVDITDNIGAGLNVNIQLKTGDGDINLSDLLVELRDFNKGAVDETLSLRLSDGKIVLLPARDLSNLMEELADLELTNDGYHIQPGQNHRLASVQDQLPEGTQWSGDVDRLDDAIALHQSPIVLADNLACVDATLRPYQWLGVSWVRHLKLHGCNGLLADDMGLGKTLQTLAYLAFEKQQNELDKPALIVVPLSLAHNWASEIERFVGHLRYKIVHGPKRHEQWSMLSDYDILITTYHLAAIDLAQWQQQSLSWLILDEAQNIKNPSAKFSQALKEISSENRMCLSGTPVENHLGELWSIIDFLMPGCLGNYKSFKAHFKKPIEDEGNERRLEQLLRRVSPFMLRRTKNQIAKDLPAKTEVSQLIPFANTQRDLYDRLKQETWEHLKSKMEDGKNEGEHHIAALTALLKLRQVCCDPLLLGEDDLPSAKREFCMEMIEELVAEGRAVLVFSQFTKMLDILEKNLAEKCIPTLMLTGKSRNRKTLVDAFQRGDAPVFLISLKAGGTGLNLTRADTIIHYDPWWNSAAERQATDRAHRIGQDKPVFVYKLIIENTIEEKIAQLQAKKATLSDYVDDQAQLSAETFALNLEELLTLWHEDKINE